MFLYFPGYWLMPQTLGSQSSQNFVAPSSTVVQLDPKCSRCLWNRMKTLWVWAALHKMTGVLGVTQHKVRGVRSALLQASPFPPHHRWNINWVLSTTLCRLEGLSRSFLLCPLLSETRLCKIVSTQFTLQIWWAGSISNSSSSALKTPHGSFFSTFWIWLSKQNHLAWRQFVFGLVLVLGHLDLAAGLQGKRHCHSVTQPTTPCSQGHWESTLNLNLLTKDWFQKQRRGKNDLMSRNNSRAPSSAQEQVLHLPGTTWHQSHSNHKGCLCWTSGAG